MVGQAFAGQWLLSHFVPPGFVVYGCISWGKRFTAPGHAVVMANWFAPFRGGTDRLYFNSTLESDNICGYAPTLPVLSQGGALAFPP
jgi:hypothetical protein